MNATVLSAYYKHKPGGFTTRLYRAYRALDAAGYRVIYVSTERLPVEGHAIEAVLLNLWSTPSSLLYWPEFCLRAILAMRRLTRQHGIRRHVLFSFFYGTLSILAGWGLNVDTLTFVRGDDVFDAARKRFAGPRVWLHRWLERFAMRHSKQVITTSDTMRNIINQRSHGDDKTVTLPNNIVTRPLPWQSPSSWTST